MAQKRQQKQQDGLHVVNKDIIFSENIKNEMKFFDKNRTEHFQLNPNRVVILAEKPNHISNIQQQNKEPQSHQSSRKDKDNDIFGNPYTDDPVEEAFSNQKLEKTLQLRDQIPRQKYNFPMTQNQEIGWFANQLNVYKPTKNFANQQCEITKFVDTYFEMTHENPFKKKRS